VDLTERPWTEFIGYDSLEISSRIVRYRKVKAKARSLAAVLEATPFYAESGGQVGDTGTLRSGEEIIHITDTKKENDLIIHFAERLPSDLQRRRWPLWIGLSEKPRKFITRLRTCCMPP